MTTDFDVLEDMLVKDWDVAYSFSIRYKHLLVNRQGRDETDEDIDHILGVSSGEEDGSEEGEDVNGGNLDDDDDENLEDKSDSDEEMGQGGLTGQYLHASGYTNTSQHPPPYSMSSPLSKQGKSKKEKNPRRTFEQPLKSQPPSRKKHGQEGYGQPYPYGPPVDPWGRPLPYGGGQDIYAGHGGYSMYGGYGGVGSPPDKEGGEAF